MREGDKVRYTRAGLRATQPPEDNAVGEVLEVVRFTDGDTLLVRWPFGTAWEDREHVKHA